MDDNYQLHLKELTNSLDPQVKNDAINFCRLVVAADLLGNLRGCISRPLNGADDVAEEIHKCASFIANQLFNNLQNISFPSNADVNHPSASTASNGEPLSEASLKDLIKLLQTQIHSPVHLTLHPSQNQQLQL